MNNINWIEVEPYPHNLLRIIGKSQKYNFQICTNKYTCGNDEYISNHATAWVYHAGDKVCNSLPNFTRHFYGNDFVGEAKQHCENFLKVKYEK